MLSRRKDRMMFRDRKDAGERLAAQLLHLKDKTPVVLALPRGGVAIGSAVARILGAPLDVVLVRKIGVPWQPELALGAVADGGAPETFIDERMQKALAIPADYVREETARQLAEVERVVRSYFLERDSLEPVARSELMERLKAGLVTVLDVRPEDEFALGHLPGAVNIPLGELEKRLAAWRFKHQKASVPVGVRQSIEKEISHKHIKYR